MLKLILLLTSLLGLSLYSSSVLAYENMIRHGYASCTTCHISETGAGLLNNYGKVIATQFSSFSQMKMPEKRQFHQGLQVRFAHYRSNGQTRNFPMQFDYLGAFQTEKYSLEATVAKAPKNESMEEESSFADEIYMRKALGTFRFNESHSLQFGRDYLDVGLNLIDHTLFIRRNNRRGVTDFFTVLRSFHDLGEGLRLSPTLFLPSYQEFSENREKGLAIKLEKFWAKQKMVATLSALKGETNSIDRQEISATLKKGWKHLVLWAQYSFTQREVLSSNTDFNQRVALASARIFPLQSLEIYFNWEDIDVQEPFFTEATRFTQGLRWKPFKNLSLEYDAKRNIHTGSKYQSIFQIYFNGWFL